MSTQPDTASDLGGIQRPKADPPSEADLPTEKELKSSVPKPPTATQRAEEKDRLMIAGLGRERDLFKSLCEQYRGEHLAACDLFKQEIDELQEELRGKEKRIEAFIGENIELRVSAKSTGCLTLVVTVFIAIGAGLVGAAGSIPNLSDVAKGGMTFIGSGIVMCGTLLCVVIWYLTPSSLSNPNKVHLQSAPITADPPAR